MGKLSCHKHKKITIITEESYSYNHIISLDDMYRYKLGIVMHKGTHFLLPQNMSSMLLRTDKIHSHKLRNHNAYYIQQIRTNTRKSTINCSGPKFWNTLPANLRQLVSIHQFKKKLKELLLTHSNGLTSLYSNVWLRLLCLII